MEKSVLGRTGLEVSVAGLGCGGYSCLGLGSGGDMKGAVHIVRSALESGINFIDTSEAYGTEEAVGQGIKGFDRSGVVLSTKFAYKRDGVMRPAAEFEKSLDASLRALQTGYIDIYHLHAVYPEDYTRAIEEYYPEMLRMKEKGKIRSCGITEIFNTDTAHLMMEKAMQQDLFDVVMVGYNMINQSARKKVLPWALGKNVGILDMFAVRNAFSKAARLQELLDKLGIESIGWLVHDGYAASVTEAAYRFCRHTEGIGIVLTGTGNHQHLTDNIRAIGMKPLDTTAVLRLHALFEGVDSVSGE